MSIWSTASRRFVAQKYLKRLGGFFIKCTSQHHPTRGTPACQALRHSICGNNSRSDDTSSPVFATLCVCELSHLRVANTFAPRLDRGPPAPSPEIGRAHV